MKNKFMPDKIYKYLFIGKHTFILRYEYSKFTKGYTILSLSYKWNERTESKINAYYLDVYCKHNGHLFGKIKLDKDIDRDIRRYLKKLSRIL